MPYDPQLAYYRRASICQGDLAMLLGLEPNILNSGKRNQIVAHTSENRNSRQARTDGDSLAHHMRQKRSNSHSVGWGVLV